MSSEDAATAPPWLRAEGEGGGANIPRSLSAGGPGLLVLLKIVADVASHRLEHGWFSAESTRMHPSRTGRAG